MDGSTPGEGRVEVRSSSGGWASVCDNGWEDTAAHVVCRQLGYVTGWARHEGHVPLQSVQSEIAITNLKCLDYFEELYQCEMSTDTHVCDKNEAAGVKCSHSMFTVA